MPLFRFCKNSRRTHFGTSRPRLHRRQHQQLHRKFSICGARRSIPSREACPASHAPIQRARSEEQSKELAQTEGVALQQLADISFPQPVDVAQLRHHVQPHRRDLDCPSLFGDQNRTRSGGRPRPMAIWRPRARFHLWHSGLGSRRQNRCLDGSLLNRPCDRCPKEHRTNSGRPGGALREERSTASQ